MERVAVLARSHPVVWTLQTKPPCYVTLQVTLLTLTLLPLLFFCCLTGRRALVFLLASNLVATLSWIASFTMMMLLMLVKMQGTYRPFRGWKFGVGFYGGLGGTGAASSDS